MFPARYFPNRYHPKRYWPPVGSTPAVVAGTGGGAGVAVVNAPFGVAAGIDELQGIQAFLGTVPCLHSAPVRWRLREGVAPVVETFQVRPQDAEALVGQVVTLKIVVRGVEHAFEKLTVLHQVPGPSPHIAAVEVADRRYVWQYGHITGRFNMRRKVGILRALDPTRELQQALPKFQYEKVSLFNENEGTPWTADELLNEMILRLLKVEEENDNGRLGAASVFFTSQVGDQISNLPIEDVEIDERADQALARVLNYMPAVGLLVDERGNINIFAKADGTERFLVERAEPEIVGEGHTKFISNAVTRPRAVRVHFTYEIETRFDFKEISNSTATTVVLDEETKELNRSLDNVLPIPDFSLRVQDEFEHQGTWLEFNQALRAWGTPPGIGGDFLTDLTIRRSLVPYMDLSPGLLLAGEVDPDNDWASRWNAVQAHYRRTFRIPQRWMDRILSIRPYRVATVDTTTGARAHAAIYMDYAVVPSARAFYGSGAADRSKSCLVVNVDTYPANDVIAAQTRAAPYLVNLIDPDQGVFTIDWVQDPGKTLTYALPGTVDNFPCGSIVFAHAQGRSVAFNLTRGSSGTVPELSASHKMATILTLIPSYPNDKRQLYAIEVTPEDVRGIVPPAVGNFIQNARGPIMDIRIPASVETARVRWSDNPADRLKIEQLFGLNLPDGAERPEVSHLIVNTKHLPNRPLNISSDDEFNELAHIAAAAAAEVYTRFTDRVVGEMAGDINQDRGAILRPTGSIREIIYEVAPDGQSTVQLSLPGEPPFTFSLFNFLDDGTRKLVLRLVQGR